MTVPDKYVTLSNGLLVSQKKNTDGTRTDYWKMDLPNSPYLFFMGVGDFAIIKDKYKDKEVSYYVEKEQAPYARGVFGLTPEMIRFFSDKLGVDYPWPKYNQIGRGSSSQEPSRGRNSSVSTPRLHCTRLRNPRAESALPMDGVATSVCAALP